MFKPWGPSDNKYVAELEAMIEQVRFDIKRMQIELKLNEVSLETIEAKQSLLKDTLDNLAKPKIKIVSLGEYKSMTFSLQVLNHNKWAAEQKKAQIESNIEAAHKKITEYKANIEQVRFKILEFKRNEKK